MWPIVKQNIKNTEKRTMSIYVCLEMFTMKRNICNCIRNHKYTEKKSLRGVFLPFLFLSVSRMVQSEELPTEDVSLSSWLRNSVS